MTSLANPLTDHQAMPTIALHFVIGSVSALGIFLVCARLSGVQRFSAPTGVLFIGFSCGMLAHYLSPWATLVVIVLYGVGTYNECRKDK
jgi:hypothetical protein